MTNGRLPNGGDTLVFFGIPTPGSANTVVQPETIHLTGLTDVWKFNDLNVDLGTGWRAAGFNDSSWTSGPGLLGVEGAALPAPIQTAVTLGRVTYYFRRHFTLNVDPSNVTLQLYGVIDDSAIVYLNGQELERFGFADASNVSFSTLAERNVGDAVLEGPFTVPKTALVMGDNVIAVEVHQITAGSGDIVFGLALDAVIDPPPQASSANLRVSEVMYNPLGGSDFEFIELINISGGAIDLSGAAITSGVQFTFAGSAITELGPGERVLVVKNLAAFEARYGTGLPVAGEFGGSLDDNGNEIVIVDTLNQIIQQFTYDDTGAWPGRADGGTSSLEVINPITAIDYSDPNTWRASSEVHGTPGTAGLGPDNRVVINEVLSHTDLPLKDSIELFNTTAGAIDISGWFISDNTDNLAKFRIPNGTIIAAGGYLVFDEDDFNPGLGSLPNDFTFNGAHGDDAYLVQADVVTQELQRFVDSEAFGAQANGESWGRFPNGSGSLTPMLSRTLGVANANPRVGPVIISEVMYHPPTPANLPVGVTVNDLEFVEIHNPTNASVLLTEWRVRGGVDFNFAAGSSLAAHSTLVIVPFDPVDPLSADKLSTFRSVYGIDAGVPLIGPFTGNLDNSGESVRLERPDEPPLEEPTFFPRLLEDEVSYDELAPWPTTAAGGGDSLHRKSPAALGRLDTSFTAAAPTPGSHVSDAAAPTVVGVWVAGGNWATPFLTYLASNGLGDKGYALPTGAAQLGPLPWTTTSKLVIQFSENVSVQQSHLSLLGVTTGSLPVSQFGYDEATFTATWTMQVVGTGLGKDKWLIAIDDAVADAAGNALDGDWMTGVSTFAGGATSGNGVAGGDFLFRFNVLPGDADGDGFVKSNDVILTRNGQFKSTTLPGYNYRLDLDTTGLVQSTDLINTRNRQFTLLPDGEPMAPAGGASASSALAAASAPVSIGSSTVESPASSNPRQQGLSPRDSDQLATVLAAMDALRPAAIAAAHADQRWSLRDLPSVLTFVRRRAGWRG